MMMMEELDLLQGSDEWFAARLGIPTASEADRIITADMVPSKQVDDLRDELISEFYTKEPVAYTISHWMKRGTELEPDARAHAEFHMNRAIYPAGFCVVTDLASGLEVYGCSPDGRYGERGDYSLGGVEIKCPSPRVHVQYLTANTLPRAYRPQVMFSMMVTGAPHWDFVSYCPRMPLLHVHVERDDKFISVLRTLTLQLIASRGAVMRQLRANGYEPITTDD